MKKSLLAVAVLGAFAGSALAADVTLYGVVDTGFAYTHTKTNGAKVNKFEMISGRQAGSRWGLKGVEDLGNGYKVGFILESGFNSDTGNQAVAGKLFNRQATLSVEGPFGTILAGRMGSVNQGTSSVGKLGMLSAFGTSYGDYSVNAASVFASDTSRDNMLTYVTPKFAGFQVYAQYSSGSDGVENKSNNTYKYVDSTGTDTTAKYETVDAKADRYAALAATYNNGPLNLYGAVDRIFYGHKAGVDMDDSLTVTFGGNYDFGVAKVFGGVQYFDEVSTSTLKGATSGVWTDTATETGKVTSYKVKGFGVNLSTAIPAFGGNILAGIGYMDGETADSVKEEANKFDIKRYRATVGYAYPFSKRTQVYAAVGYGKDERDWNSAAKKDKNKVEAATAMFGLRHNF